MPSESEAMLHDQSQKDASKEESDKCFETVTLMAGNQGVVAALLLAFTYASNAETIDLGTVCDGTDCNNAWGSLGSCEIVIDAYRVVNFVCSILLLVNVAYNSMVIQEFCYVGRIYMAAEMHKSLTNSLKLPTAAIVLALMLFTCQMVLQASLVMPTAVFWPVFIYGSASALLMTASALHVRETRKRVEREARA